MTTASHARSRTALRAWRTLVGAEIRMVVRDTAGLIIPIGMPALMMIVNGLSAAQTEVPGTGMSALELYVLPLVIGMVLALVGVVNMPSFLALYRRSGILRRLAVTPVRPSMVLGAQVITSGLQSAVGIVLAIVAAAVIFGVSTPTAPLLVVGMIGLTAVAMYAIGMHIAAVAPTPNSAVAIGLVVFFGMGATGGMFGPTSTLPEPFVAIGSVLPFGAGSDAIRAAWLGVHPDPLSLLSLAVAIVVSSVGAALLFRWE